jgi:hypothetical protein
VRFADFLKTTVLLSAGAASALATVTVLSASGAAEARLALLCAGWWALAALLGALLGRRADTSPAIARLLAAARASTALPEQRPGAILLNRLWPLLLFTMLAGGLAFLAPQIPGIGAGFAIIWALAWRRQHSAVTAIEERDGVRFYVLRTSPLRPIALQRTPGFKALRPERSGGAAA